MDGKLGVLDVKVRTRSKKVIDVEIQVLPTPELRWRVVFYTAKMVVEQINSGDDYLNIKRVISIIITGFEFIPDNDAYHNRYTLRDLETGSEFTDLIEVNTLELAKLPLSEDGTKLWCWMKFLSAQNKEELDMIAEASPQIRKAVVRLMELSSDERTRMLYESRQKMEWDIAARERVAKAEGREEGREEMAINLLADGVSPEIIAKSAGLPLERIQALMK
jgi:predicted transposase/invertase (TIGR01784 family)